MVGKTVSLFVSYSAEAVGTNYENVLFRVYVAPHVHPLEEGPDFSFVGR
jgi:hypothetical protein